MVTPAHTHTRDLIQSPAAGMPRWQWLELIDWSTCRQWVIAGHGPSGSCYRDDMHLIFE